MCAIAQVWTVLVYSPHHTLRPGDTEGYGQTGQSIPCYSTHHTQAWRYRGLWTDGQSYLAIAHTTLRPGDSRGLWTDGQSYLAIAHTTLSAWCDTEGYDRRTVIPCYSTHHTQVCEIQGLWTDGQSYLAIAHTTLRPGDTEGYGQTDSHTLL